jgi:hypothetical protein
MVSLLRTEARQRMWTDGEVFHEELPAMHSTSSKGRMGKADHSVSTTLPSVRPKTSQGPDYSTSAGSLEEMMSASRPSTSPGAVTAGEGSAREAANKYDDRQKKTNPFEEFTSSADIEEMTRKRMNLEDRAQAFAMEAFQHQSAYLRGNLKTKSMEELTENRVVFSRGAMAAMEKDQATDLFGRSAENLGDVYESSRMLKTSQKKVTELNKDLELLNLVADQARGKVTMIADGVRGLEKVDRAGVKGVFASLSVEDRQELKSFGIAQDHLDHLCQFYLRIRSPSERSDAGERIIDKDLMRRTLAKSMIRGTLSKERFEDLWQTLLPIGSYDVSFMDFVRWASRCLPVKILADDEEFSISKKFSPANVQRPSYQNKFMRQPTVERAADVDLNVHFKDRVRESLLGLIERRE